MTSLSSVPRQWVAVLPGVAVSSALLVVVVWFVYVVLLPLLVRPATNNLEIILIVLTICMKH